MEEKLDIADIGYVRKMMQTASLGPSLESAELASIRQKSKDEEKIAKEIATFKNGYEILDSQIKKNANGELIISGEEGEMIPISFCLLTENEKKDLFNRAHWEPTVDLLELCGYSEKALLTLYQMAVGLHREALYQESGDAFYFLCRLAPPISSFWIGRGLALESQQNYEDALEAYEQAVQARTNDFSPFYGMMRCCKEFKDFTRVKALLNEHKENSQLKNKIIEALGYIQSLEKRG